MLANGTAAFVSDDTDAEYVLATAMRSAGVASSKGSLTGAPTAAQEVTQEKGLSAGLSRRVRRGSYVSMLNTYTYVFDLGKITTTEG